MQTSNVNETNKYRNHIEKYIQQKLYNNKKSTKSTKIYNNNKITENGLQKVLNTKIEKIEQQQNYIKIKINNNHISEYRRDNVQNRKATAGRQWQRVAVRWKVRLNSSYNNINNNNDTLKQR